MTDKKIATSPEKKAALISLRDQYNGADAPAQRERLLQALGRYAISTFEASRYLDIYDVRPRVWELRHKHGRNIDTVWQIVVTESGQTHRVGVYSLRPVDAKVSP